MFLRSLLPASSLSFCLLLFSSPASSQAGDDEHPLSGMPLRLIGPALTSGRVSYDIARTAFGGVIADLEALAGDLSALESELEDQGAPWTPGRIPEWK